MKTEHLVDALEKIDESYIVESDPGANGAAGAPAPKLPKKKPVVKILLIAAAVALLVTAAVTLSVFFSVRKPIGSAQRTDENSALSPTPTPTTPDPVTPTPVTPTPVTPTPVTPTPVTPTPVTPTPVTPTPVTPTPVTPTPVTPTPVTPTPVTPTPVTPTPVTPTPVTPTPVTPTPVTPTPVTPTPVTPTPVTPTPVTPTPVTPTPVTPTPIVSAPRFAFSLNTDDNTYTLIAIYANEGDTIDIPDTYNGLPVTAIADMIVIPDNCKVYLPDNVSHLRSDALNLFDEESYTRYDNALYLGNPNNPYLVLAKAVDTSITSVEIHPQTRVIATYAFQNCASLTEVTLPDSVCTIEEAAFSGCTSLESVDLGSITNLSDAFVNCPNLHTLTLPDTLQVINGEIGKYNQQLEFSYYQGGKYLGSAGNPYFALVGVESESTTEVIAHPDTALLASAAFTHCENLVRAVLPDSVTSLTNTFAFCTSLTEVVLPQGLKTIGNYAFFNCYALEKLELPDSIEVVNSSFKDCKNLNCLTENNLRYLGTPSNPHKVLIGMVIYSGDCEIHEDTEILAAECMRGYGTMKALVIPDNVRFIGDYCFHSSSFTQITVGQSVTTIGQYAFAGSSYLKAVDLPDGLRSIGQNAFGGCSLLMSADLPDGITEIPTGLFWGAGRLKSIRLPSTLSLVSLDAFKETKLKTVYFPGGEENWNAVLIGEGNELLETAEIIFGERPQND